MSEINTKYYDNLKDKIDGTDNCEGLLKTQQEVITSTTSQIAAIQQQLAVLQPLLSLLSAPTSPDAAVTWITDFISKFLTPLVVPVTTYPAQITALAMKQAELLLAIGDKSGEIEGCDIPPPPEEPQQ